MKYLKIIAVLLLIAVCTFLSCEVEGEIQQSRSKKTTAVVITIHSHPAEVTQVTAGSISASLSVSASATPSETLIYQWYSNTSNRNSGGTEISGATSAVFAIPKTLTAGTYYYYCIVQDAGGTVAERSNVATVTVYALPALTTLAVTAFDNATATLGGNVSNAGTPAYIERGVCYSTTRNPTTANHQTPVAGAGTGNFTTGVSGLTPNTTYYVRAYAISAAGTAYGNEVSFRYVNE